MTKNEAIAASEKGAVIAHLNFDFLDTVKKVEDHPSVNHKITEYYHLSDKTDQKIIHEYFQKL